MRHLVGTQHPLAAPVTGSIAVCGARLAPEPTIDRYQATTVVERVTCSACMVSFDLLLQADLAKPVRHETARKSRKRNEHRIEIDKRAFPMVPLSPPPIVLHLSTGPIRVYANPMISPGSFFLHQPNNQWVHGLLPFSEDSIAGSPVAQIDRAVLDMYATQAARPSHVDVAPVVWAAINNAMVAARRFEANFAHYATLAGG